MKKHISPVLSLLCVQAMAQECIEGGKISEGKVCTYDRVLEVGTKLENEGTLILENGAGLLFYSPLNDDFIVSITGSKQGKIDIRANVDFAARPSHLAITNQNVTIQDGQKLRIGAQSLILGETNKETSISTNSSGVLELVDMSRFILKNAKLANMQITSDTLSDVYLGNVKLNNTAIISEKDLKVSGVDSSTPFVPSSQNSSSASANPTITLKGENYIKSSGKVTLNKGTYDFNGGGVLFFTGKNVIVGDEPPVKKGSQNVVLKGSNSNELQSKTPLTSVAFYASDDKSGGILFNKVEVQDLSVRIVRDGSEGAILKNIQTSFMGGILEGKDTSGKSQVLVIENGNQAKQAQMTLGQQQVGVIKIGEMTIQSQNLGTPQNPLTTTFQGAGIKIYGQQISIGNGTGSSSLTLLLKTDEDNGNITLGKQNTKSDPKKQVGQTMSENKDGEVTIQGGNSGMQLNLSTAKQNLQLRSKSVTFDGSVTLKNLSVQTQSKHTGIMFLGKGANSTLTLESVDITAGIKNEKNEGKYQSLNFLSEGTEHSNLAIKTDIMMKASTFLFRNQKVTITKNGTGTNGGKSLNLYAYGQTSLGDSAPQEVGIFSFYDTHFTEDLQTAITAQVSAESKNPTLKLYAGEKGAKVLSGDLILENVDLESYKINSQVSNRKGNNGEKNTLDLSDSSSNLTALGNVNITAKEFKYKQENGKATEGVGMDIYVGNAAKTGKLILKSSSSAMQTAIQEENPSFILGGVLTLDSSSANSNHRGINPKSVFDIEIGSNKLSDHKIVLVVEGGLSAIHVNASNQSTEIKAKSFDFKPSSVVHVRNGTLKLISTDGKVEVKGRAFLEGTDTAKASIEANKKANGLTLQDKNPMLTLHDVIVVGSAKLENNFEFKNSNIIVQSNGKDRTFTIKGQNGSSTNSINNISSITLKSGIVDIQNGMQNSQVELKLNANAVITSSGDSELKTAGISVNGAPKNPPSGTNSTFSLNVLDGTLTLLETQAKNMIGKITLGTKDKPNGGNLVLLKGNGAAASPPPPKTPEYNKLTLNDALTSYGDSSITASEFAVNNQASISVNDGKLDLIAKNGASSNNGLKIQSGEIMINNGALSYYASQAAKKQLKTPQSPQLGTMTLGKKPQALNAILETHTKITSKGTSSIQAQKLTLQDTEIFAQNGSLDLIGLDDTSSFGNIDLTGASLTAYKNSTKNEQSSIKLGMNKTITMHAEVPFVTPTQPLGGASFGHILAKSVEFKGDSMEGQTLITLKVAQPKEMKGEALFSLREGDQILIQTQDGIKKTANHSLRNNIYITLSDVSVSVSGYKSLYITPRLISDEIDPTKITALALGISVKQGTILELTEGIEDAQKRQEMVDMVSGGRREEIANSILTSPDNPLKIGIAENTMAGNVAVISQALYFAEDTFATLAKLSQFSYGFYQQIAHLTSASLYDRLTRIGNPHPSTDEFASLLKSVANKAYVSNDDEILFDEEVGVTEIGGLWASYSGAMRSGKSTSGNVNGLSAGYDAILRSNILLGGFVSYLYGNQKESYLHNASHNVNFGLYSRMIFGENEIDWVAMQSIGINTSTISVGYGLAGMFSGEFKHNAYATNLQMRYGYAFTLGEQEDPYYLKPFIGLQGVLWVGDSIELKSQAPIQAEGIKNFFLDVVAGLELRKYFNPQSYFFIIPLMEAGVVSIGESVNVGFVGSNPLNYVWEKSNEVNLGVYAGGQGSVAENLAITGSMGIKMGVKNTDVLTSWNVGLRYKF